MTSRSQNSSVPEPSLGGSLWLVPEPGSFTSKILQDLIKHLSEVETSWGTNISKPFSPHVTITSGITDYFLSSARKVDFPGYSFVHLDELKLKTPEIKMKEVVLGDSFYKRVFIRLHRTETLLSLVRTLRSQFVGESSDALDEFMNDFDPHISLAYAEAFTAVEKSLIRKELKSIVESLDLSVAFQYIVLMDTRSKAATASVDKALSWKACPIRLAL